MNQKSICTTSRANTNNFAQVCSLQVHLPIWWALHPFQPEVWILLRPRRLKVMKAVSWAMDQTLWCLADNTCFPKAHGNQVLDPPHTNKWELPEEDLDLSAVDTSRESWTCTPEGDIQFSEMDSISQSQVQCYFYFILHFPDSGFLSRFIVCHQKPHWGLDMGIP